MRPVGYLWTSIALFALQGCNNQFPANVQHPYVLSRWKQLSDHELSATLPLKVVSVDRPHAVDIFKSDRQSDLRRRALNALPTEDVVRLLDDSLTPEESGWILQILLMRRSPLDAALRSAIARASDSSKREILETGTPQLPASKRLILDDLKARLLTYVITEEEGTSVSYRATVLAGEESFTKDITLDSRGTKIVRILAPRTASSFRVQLRREGQVVYDKPLSANKSWKVVFKNRSGSNEVSAEPE